jgi:hypothetical protein
MIFAILFSVLTTLSDGMFHSTYTTDVQADVSASNMAVDSFITHLQTEPLLLAEWAFAGMGRQQDSEKNAMYLKWKYSEYNPQTHYSKLIVDVLVDDKPRFKDVTVECIVRDTLINNIRDVHVDIFYSGSLLKQAYGNFHVIPLTDTTSQMAIDMHVKFGWFFRIFITRRIYRETIDWRVERFVTNLKMRAEGDWPSDAFWRSVDSPH